MTSDLFDLSGTIALVTGSSRGLGLSLAQGLGEAGATVILNGVNEERLTQTVQALSEKGIQTHGCAFDVADSAQVKEKIEAVEKEVGPIDVLVNNAGVQIRGPLEEFDESEWDRLIATNLKGVFLVARQVAQGMIERRAGKIINIGSLACELARPTIAPYAASKGGVKMLTRAMATEWGRHNIQVNGIGPGYFITDMTRPLVEDEEFNAWLRRRVPAGRWGEPSELVGAAIFLASKASDYVSGHMLYVDGGLMACV